MGLSPRQMARQIAARIAEKSSIATDVRENAAYPGECQANQAERRARLVDSGENGPMDRLYAIPAPERDRMILLLRRAGWTYKRIGRRVGMSESGVARALERIRAGHFGEGMTRA